MLNSLSVNDKKTGIDWKWQVIDGIITNAPLAEKGTGANPTDRAKSGTKRSMLVDGKGVSLGITVDAANKHDMNMRATLLSIVIHRPRPPSKPRQHICMDKGYDFPEVHELLEDYGCTIHIQLKARRGLHTQSLPAYRSRHWVVGRTHSWMNQLIRFLIRCEK